MLNSDICEPRLIRNLCFPSVQKTEKLEALVKNHDSEKDLSPDGAAKKVQMYKSPEDKTGPDSSQQTGVDKRAHLRAT